MAMRELGSLKLVQAGPRKGRWSPSTPCVSCFRQAGALLDWVNPAASECALASGAVWYLPVAELRDMPYSAPAVGTGHEAIAERSQVSSRVVPIADLILRNRHNPLAAQRASAQFDKKLLKTA